MHNPAIDEDIGRIFATLTSNGKEGEEETGKLENEEPEEFDVYIEADRITVVKRPEPEAKVIDAVKPSEPQPYVALGVMTVSLLLILYLVTSACILTFFPPIVTVTIIPKAKVITATGTVQLPARQIPPISLSESLTVQTTGRGHQDSKSGTGFITFYNGQFQSITIPAGTTLTGKRGVPVITDQNADIPAASINPPAFGYITVSAHAINTGSNGNIAAYDINSPCCFASVIAKNPETFTGGKDERNFQTVTKSDIDNAASTLKATISDSMHGAITAQVKQSETLITLPCSPTVSPNHNIGEEATQVKVTEYLTCSGIAYDSTSLETRATQLLTQQAVKKLGTGYSLIGDMQVSVKHATVNRNTTPPVFLSFTSTGTWVYAVNTAGEQRIKHLIAGKRKQDALHLLLLVPGIEQAVISWGDDSRLPKDIKNIHIRLLVV